MSRRDLLLYGTEQPPTVLQAFRCGPLGFSLDGGNVRYITWRGVEVLRAISFIVRDSNWGTYAPTLSGFREDESADRIEIGYSAQVEGTEGDFSFEARIVGTADGTLSFTGSGISGGGFRTNRTGFVVLHGIEGVAGVSVEVEHASGGRETTAFPKLVDPSQPIFDIRTLTHAPAHGLTVAVTMEGEAYEMEDQRNWTDASFKTYVRPLAKGFPYDLMAGERIEQRVTLRVAETARSARAAAALRSDIVVGSAAGVVPDIGLALASWTDRPAVAPSYLVGRVDLTSAMPALPDAPPGIPIDLDVLIPGRDPATELAPLSKLAFTPRWVLVVPARDMRSRPANQTPTGEATYEAILAAARRAFPRSQVGGGMFVNFPELNRNRPPQGIDFVAHSTSAIVHAADDHSVMETHEALASVVASVRAFAGDIPYRLGPATIGAPQPFYQVPSAGNPDAIRKTTADADPRQHGLFAAAFAIGYAAAAAWAGVEALTLGCTTGSAGIAGVDGPYPVATAVQWLAALAGWPRLEATAPPGLAVIAAAGPAGRELLIANLTAEARTFGLSGIREANLLDVEALAGGNGSRTIAVSGAITLDAYAICRAIGG
jgi:hypothetical protein